METGDVVTVVVSVPDTAASASAAAVSAGASGAIFAVMGAMIYVVVEELIPEMSTGEHSNIGTIFFATGFSFMMILDVALG